MLLVVAAGDEDDVVVAEQLDPREALARDLGRAGEVERSSGPSGLAVGLSSRTWTW
jgi:hypothetical protein